MKAPYLKSKAFICFCALFVALGVIAHPGGLDKNGGHTDRKTGIYHYHRGTNAPSASSTPRTESVAPVPFDGRVEAMGSETDNMAAVAQEAYAGA